MCSLVFVIAGSLSSTDVSFLSNGKVQRFVLCLVIMTIIIIIISSSSDPALKILSSQQRAELSQL